MFFEVQVFCGWETLAALQQSGSYPTVSPLALTWPEVQQLPESELGQTEKNSLRANVFRVAPESGLCSMQSALRICAVIRRAYAGMARTEALLARREQRGRIARGYWSLFARPTLVANGASPPCRRPS